MGGIDKSKGGICKEETRIGGVVAGVQRSVQGT
jgi:hypothetical protein